MINIDTATLTLWASDVALLGLAYLVGRIHGYYLSCQQYRVTLEQFINEIKSMRQVVDRLRDVESLRRIHENQRAQETD
jgi:hypothetical protein